ncbi:MAG: hypothetical protein JRM80_11595 [Nitrososphaerota archaeon]|nr:hypothetical protein [Nitrososphaerota archaeon]MDG6991538.1 hypothetical protein [Nitrososphaerota archaeon]
MRASLTMVQAVFLIVLQVVSLVVLWTSDPLTQVATDTFALYLSLELLAFAMISYIYRSRRAENEPSLAWLSVGYLALMVLLVSNLIIAA